jgi:hypothetical protein
LNNVHTCHTGVSWIPILGMELESILALPLVPLVLQSKKGDMWPSRTLL